MPSIGIESAPDAVDSEYHSGSDTRSMTNHISIQVEDDEQYERLQQVRAKYGLTWKGLLIQGARRVEEDDPAVGDDDEP